MSKPVIFAITDVETTKKNGLVFDIGWQFVDRKGRTYATGSYLIKDIFAHDNPFYREKMAQYWTQVWKHIIRPASFRMVRKMYNRDIAVLKSKGHRVVFVAYNAAFDVRQLGETSQRMLGKPFLENKVELLDLWHAFCEHIPVNFQSELSDALNWRTNAEWAYRYTTKLLDFKEKHMGFSDTGIEKHLLLNVVLPRKKTLPIVSHPDDFVNMPWKIAQEKIKTPKTDDLIMPVIERVLATLDIPKIERLGKKLLDLGRDDLYSLLHEQRNQIQGSRSIQEAEHVWGAEIPDHAGTLSVGDNFPKHGSDTSVC